ncbi:hypothetical protein G3580_07505 [Nitrogeniibacter mangrovi]|uniref:Uncharacterized protein n=1 Tax=Nitrogeniibacter mangrovi TaxID=2016596 RepID=A0A6C1B1K3_9RHOO|nr:hypothetical protein [Nitrogeniibacter mangrovi]QID17501.1 hypothetical protein G3580_07505 [Nitrogeniibacter mangrovi]
MHVTPSRYTLRGIPVSRGGTSRVSEAEPAPASEAVETTPPIEAGRTEVRRSIWLDLLHGRISLDALFGD